MNMGAETGSPWRFASSTCPSSCTRIRKTKPTANCQPHRSAYAPIETIIEPATVKILNLKSAAKMNFSFQIAKPIAAIGAHSLRSTSRNVVGCLIGE